MSALKDYQFPLYNLRDYQRIFEDGAYICIETAKNRWVLDYKYKTDDYFSRRVALVSDPLKPYKLYPLSKRVDNVIQMKNAKTNMFIDSGGSVLKYTPSVWYKIKTGKILARWHTRKGHIAYAVAGTSRTFVFPDTSVYYNYAQYVVAKKRVMLLDMLEEPNDRKRIKL